MAKKSLLRATLMAAAVIGILTVDIGPRAWGSPDNGMRLLQASITVQNSVIGTTTQYIGATEAGGFWVEDLTDLGINTYRLWTKMDELEWWDDDDAPAYQCTEIGTPTIAQIKADQAGGFVNTIPWSWWDTRFNETQSWRYGVQTRRGIIEALVQGGITPLLVLRTRDDQGKPNYCGGDWSPIPNPTTETDLNEWWEHCFAVAYWLNVQHSHGVTHFEVLNEPDYSGQGWAEYGGTTAEYALMVQTAYDAVKYANDIAGIDTIIHAPVVANYNSSYVAYTLDNADAAVQVVDYHTYATDVRPSITGIRNTISNHNPDGILEPIWNSEWGALWSSYNTFSRAMTTANQLLTFSEEEVEGVTVFNMYDWSTTAGQDYGLVDLQDDGMGGANRAYTETYYAYRLMTRGSVGGKERLGHTASGFSGTTRTMVTRDGDYVYVIVLLDGAGAPTTVNVDLTAIGSGSGTVTVWEYSAAHKDVVVQTPTMINAQFSFTAPADGISLARVDRDALAVRLTSLTARPLKATSPWVIWVALGLAALGCVGLVAAAMRCGQNDTVRGKRGEEESFSVSSYLVSESSLRLRSGQALAIEAHGLVKRFPRAQGWRDLARLLPQWRDRPGITALDGVDLAVRRGEVFGLVGPNGAGKTTLIKVLCALILPTAGRARVNGYDLGQDQAIKTSVGLVAGDERSFYWRLSGRDNLIFFGRLHGLGRGRAAERAEELLAQVGLAEVADRRFQTYSAGMRQRLAIARGMLHAPAILFMDEPTLSLDPNATRRIHTLIREGLVDRQGTTVFLATHRLDEATALCDRVAILDRGRVRASGTLAELRGLLPGGQRYEIVVRGLTEPERALKGLPCDLEIRVHAGADTRLTFTALDHTDALQQVLERVWTAGGTIQAVHSQPASLEEVFALVTGVHGGGPHG